MNHYSSEHYEGPAVPLRTVKVEAHSVLTSDGIHLLASPFSQLLPIIGVAEDLEGIAKAINGRVVKVSIEVVS